MQRFQVSPSLDARPSRPPPRRAGCGRRSFRVRPTTDSSVGDDTGSVRSRARLQQLLNGDPSPPIIRTELHPKWASCLPLLLRAMRRRPAPPSTLRSGCPLETCGTAQVWAWAHAQPGLGAEAGSRSADAGDVRSAGSSLHPACVCSQPPVLITDPASHAFHLRTSVIPCPSQPPGGSGRPLRPSLPVLLLLPGGPDPTRAAHTCAQCWSQGLGGRARPGGAVARRYQDAAPRPPANLSSLLPPSQALLLSLRSLHLHPGSCSLCLFLLLIHFFSSLTPLCAPLLPCASLFLPMSRRSPCR